MRLFAIGDIHGCATALDTLLSAIRLGKDDKLVALGDYINKGPETKATLDYLLTLYNKGYLIPLLGNHELKLLAAGQYCQPQVGNHLLVDEHTFSSYGKQGEMGDLSDIPNAHWAFVRDLCQHWFETDSHIFVHANLQPNLPLSEQPQSALFWDKFNAPPPHISGKVMVCGHTPQRSGQPLNLGHAICLDTAACEGGWLTCLEVNSGQIWQANQRRELKTSQLESPSNPAEGEPSACQSGVSPQETPSQETPSQETPPPEAVPLEKAILVTSR